MNLFLSLSSGLFFCMGARAWTDTYTCVYMQTVLEIEYVGIDFPGPPCSLRARSQEYEELKKNPTIKRADRHMCRTRSRQGWYQGCFSETKWGGQRRRHKWDVLLASAPKLANIYTEIPNSLRSLLGIQEMKHANGKFSKAVSGLHNCPAPLAFALETILDERMSLGEECTADFAAKTLSILLEAWNENIKELRQMVQEAVGQELLHAQNESITEDMSLDEISHITNMMKKKMDTIINELQPFQPDAKHKAFRTMHADCTPIFLFCGILFSVRLNSLVNNIYIYRYMHIEFLGYTMLCS